jgi:hypothetical protein
MLYFESEWMQHNAKSHGFEFDEMSHRTPSLKLPATQG